MKKRSLPLCTYFMLKQGDFRKVISATSTTSLTLNSTIYISTPCQGPSSSWTTELLRHPYHSLSSTNRPAPTSSSHRYITSNLHLGHLLTMKSEHLGGEMSLNWHPGTCFSRFPPPSLVPPPPSPICGPCLAQNLTTSGYFSKNSAKNH